LGRLSDRILSIKKLMSEIKHAVVCHDIGGGATRDDSMVRLSIVRALLSSKHRSCGELESCVIYVSTFDGLEENVVIMPSSSSIRQKFAASKFKNFLKETGLTLKLANKILLIHELASSIKAAVLAYCLLDGNNGVDRKDVLSSLLSDAPEALSDMQYCDGEIPIDGKVPEA